MSASNKERTMLCTVSRSSLCRMKTFDVMFVGCRIRLGINGALKNR
jgi:hypothetical protein